MESSAAPREGTPTPRVVEVAFRALADRLDECVFLTDRQGRYVAVNGDFARWVGRPESEILGRTAFDLWPTSVAEGDAADDRRAQDGENVERDEQRPRGAETRQARTRRIPVRDETGAVHGVLGSIRDATPDRAADEARSEGARMELVGRLASGVAHDFNNLMTVVLGHLALLRDYVAAEGPHQELMGGAEKAAAHAADLSRQLLAFLRMEPAVPEPVDLNAVVGQVMGLLRRTFDPRIQIDVRLQPGLPRTPAVRTQLGQLLLNLCLNARDAMPRGGRLLVETSVTGMPVEEVRLRPQRRTGAFVRLRVADTGEGIAPVVQARMFEPAFTTKGQGQGTGLGLAIVRSVVEQHHGWIECVSGVGQGACFDVYLPLEGRGQAVGNSRNAG